MVTRDGSDLRIKFSAKHHPFIAAVKTIRGYRWDPATYAWRVHVGHVRQVKHLADTHGWTLSPEVLRLPDLNPGDIPIVVSVEGEQLVLDSPWRDDVEHLMAERDDARHDPRSGRWFVPLEAAVDVVLDVRAIAKVKFVGDARDVENRIERAARMLALSRQLEPSPGWQLVDTFRRTLHPFQHPGVEYLTIARRGFSWATMGAGKTTVALAALEHLDAFPALVVPPAGLKTNWAREVAECIPHRSVFVCAGMRPQPPIDRPDIWIANYDVLGKPDTDSWSALFRDLDLEALVIDEGHRIANSKTIRTEAVIAISDSLPPDAPRYLLTGTPVRNRRVEILPQLEAIGRTGEFGNARQLKADKRLARRLRTVCAWRPDPTEVLRSLGVVKADGTADVIEQTVLVDGDPKIMVDYRKAEARFLDYLRDKAREEAERLGGDPDAAAIAAMMKAHAAQHLMLVNTLCRLAGQAKVKAAREWIDDFLDSGEKLLVFAENHDVMDALAQAVKPPLPQIKGDVSTVERDAIVDRFQEQHGGENDPVQAIVLQIDAAGEGLTLTRAYQVLHAQLKWTPGAHDQANARAAWRMNDPHNVIAHYLVCADTIDEIRMDVLDAKRSEMAAVVDGDRDEIANTSTYGDVFARMLNKALGITEEA